MESPKQPDYVSKYQLRAVMRTLFSATPLCCLQLIWLFCLFWGLTAGLGSMNTGSQADQRE